MSFGIRGEVGHKAAGASVFAHQTYDRRIPSLHLGYERLHFFYFLAILRKISLAFRYVWYIHKYTNYIIQILLAITYLLTYLLAYRLSRSACQKWLARCRFIARLISLSLLIAPRSNVATPSKLSSERYRFNANSVRCPAIWCGVYRHKFTYDVNGASGSCPTSWRADGTVFACQCRTTVLCWRHPVA